MMRLIRTVPLALALLIPATASAMPLIAPARTTVSDAEIDALVDLVIQYEDRYQQRRNSQRMMYDLGRSSIDRRHIPSPPPAFPTY